jgi:hypothetical protein
MGTNYYVSKNFCECCKRYDKEYHIGKLSYGWAFAFRGYTWMRITSWESWKEFLKDKMIVDEDGIEVPYDWFVHMIETNGSSNFVNHHTGKQNLSHIKDTRKYAYDPNPAEEWEDKDGYFFTVNEFS